MRTWESIWSSDYRSTTDSWFDDRLSPHIIRVSRNGLADHGSIFWFPLVFYISEFRISWGPLSSGPQEIAKLKFLLIENPELNFPVNGWWPGRRTLRCQNGCTSTRTARLLGSIGCRRLWRGFWWWWWWIMIAKIFKFSIMAKIKNKSITISWLIFRLSPSTSWNWQTTSRTKVASSV